MKCAMWLLVGMAAAPAAWGGYILEVSSNGQHAISVQPSAQFPVEVTLTRNTADAQVNEAIDSFEFVIEVSEPGVQYLSYSFSAPFVAGGSDDYSEPKLGGSIAFPMVITPSLDNGWGIKTNALDVSVQAFNAGVETFSEGVLLTLQFRAPASGGNFGVQAYSTGDFSFSGPAGEFTAIQGQQLLVAVPEPSICISGAVVALGALGRRQRQSPKA